MALRRFSLLILGIAGSVLAATVLYISAEAVLRDRDLLRQDPVQVNTQLILPAEIPGTTLIAQKLVSYEGPFLEDGSDREVVNVAALQVFNTGTKEVLQACVELWREDTAYKFYAERIPPGGTVLILESSGSSYLPDGFTACSGRQLTAQSEPETRKQISVSDRAMGTVVVTNLTDKNIEDISLYYKSWLSPPGIYVGGICYTATIPVLLPGQTLEIFPHHYASGYSKVVSVTIG